MRLPVLISDNTSKKECFKMNGNELRLVFSPLKHKAFSQELARLRQVSYCLISEKNECDLQIMEP
jgi:hypothetical protein